MFHTALKAGRVRAENEYDPKRTETPMTFSLQRTSLIAVVVLTLGAGGDPARQAMPPVSPKFDPPANALFAEAFRDRSLEGWSPDRPGVWTVVRGVLRADLPDKKQEFSFIHAGDSTWTDYAVDLDVCGMRGVDKGVVVRASNSRGLGVDLRGPGYSDLLLHVNQRPVGRAGATNGNGTWYHLRVELRGTECRALVDGNEVIRRKITVPLPASGRIALPAYTGGVGQCTVYYDNIVVTRLKTL